MQQDQDLFGLNMETEFDHDWVESIDIADEIHEAVTRIYKAVDELEVLYNCQLPDLRADIRFIETTAIQAVNYERE